MKGVKGRGRGKKCTIEGIVTPSEWDEQYNVVGVKIAAAEEKEYLIHHDPQGEKLLAHIRETLRLTGRMRRDEHGNKILWVEEYQRVDPCARPLARLAPHSGGLDKEGGR